MIFLSSSQATSPVNPAETCLTPPPEISSHPPTSISHELIRSESLLPHPQTEIIQKQNVRLFISSYYVLANLNFFIAWEIRPKIKIMK